jgi:tRNA modification GTPase
MDTIVAPATPPGEGGVAIVRISGPDAEPSLAACFEGKIPPPEMKSHHLHHGWLRHPDGRLVDEVLAVIMRAPHSYTGEDVVEIHCHGGSQIMRGVLDLFLGHRVRLARPGEFTERAFLNGRMDLAQAEAVAELIDARSEQACRAALGQLEGRLSSLIFRYTDQLRNILSLVEAHVDFPNDEVGELDRQLLLAQLTALGAEMNGLAGSFDTGRALREGINLLILGRPNVGKSSLMNALLGQARAIVTEVPGTTRDTVEEQMVLGGFPVRLIDTAGVRATADPVEREGVRRASEKAQTADLVLLVVDGSAELTSEDRMAMGLCDPSRALAVINKADLTSRCDRTALAAFGAPVEVSARNGSGLSALQDAVVARLGGGVGGDVAESVVILERRHREALLQALAALNESVAAARANEPLECLAFELREALSALGQISGETTPDEILEQIFSRFCVGK